jgi:DNA-binding PadR family transcriptional regulator
MLDRIDPIATVRTVFEGDVIMRNVDSGLEGPHREHRGRRHGERRRRGGFSSDFGVDFGPASGPRGRRRGRAGRGDVRAAIISLLNEEPRNGYQIIQEINERTGGLWRVSSGSVYPAISQLEDEGLIEPADGNGRRLFALTQAGREYSEQNAEQLARLWEVGAEDARLDDFLQYRELIGQLAAAARQVNDVGTQAQRGEAKQVLTRARQSLYKLLAADAVEDAAEPTDSV